MSHTPKMVLGLNQDLEDRTKCRSKALIKTLAMLWVLLLVLFDQAVVSAREKAAGKGVGSVSCAQFGKDYQEDPQYWESFYFSWAQGYMSGLNTALIFRTRGEHEQSTDLGKWSPERQEAFVRSYCDQHPLRNYREAAEALFSEMRKEQLLGDWQQELLP